MAAAASGAIQLSGSASPTVTYKGSATGRLEISADVRNDIQDAEIACLSGDGVEPVDSKRLGAGYAY
jgi:hypothetical protein